MQKTPRNGLREQILEACPRWENDTCKKKCLSDVQTFQTSGASVFFERRISNTAVWRSVTLLGLKSDRNFRGSSEREMRERERDIFSLINQIR